MLHPENLDTIEEFVPSTDPRSTEYNKIAKLRLAEFELRENRLPRASTTEGFAWVSHPYIAYDGRRICELCRKSFNVSEYDQPCANQCLYNCNQKTDDTNAYLCCKQLHGSPGCKTNYHVSRQIPLVDMTTFISFPTCDENHVITERDVYALDCEMCYTVAGAEVTRITIVDINRLGVYDTHVKPSGRVIDYNTAYSGINEDTLKDVTCTLSDVHTELRNRFHSKTILVVHSLDCDFKALKLVHNMVVDTSVMYMERQGRQSVKRRLKSLASEKLGREIQEDGRPHSSLEDAIACMDLVKDRVIQKDRKREQKDRQRQFRRQREGHSQEKGEPWM